MASPVIDTLSGTLRGKIEKSSEDFDFCAFKGIPYAKPPVGPLRFKDPEPFEWLGVIDATKHGGCCAQKTVFIQTLSYNEDCLTLNVYTKYPMDVSKPKPVMFWIHGGAFYFGSGDDNLYAPDYLIKKNVVLVTANYRLAVFGFLDLEHECATGNQGLKDQVMAMRWVRDNIGKFGGDPNNVTIFGESCGAACVHYHTLSPFSKGLFHKAISQSGTAFAPWTTKKDPRRVAQRLCSMLGKDLLGPEEILEFLRKVDAKELVEAHDNLIAPDGTLPFAPGMDDKSANPFMPVPVDELASQGVHLPYLLGWNIREGIYFYLGHKLEDIFSRMDKHVELILSFQYERVLERYGLTKEQFRRLYYKSERVTEKNYHKYIDLAGDLYCIECTHRLAKVQAEKSSAPTYLYRLSYDSGNSILRSMLTEPVPGTCHSDDIEYLFKHHFYEQIGKKHLEKGTRAYKIMEQMTEMWSNFAKYGRPTIIKSELTPVHWQPVSDGKVLRYLNIDEDTTMQTTLNLEEKYLSAKNIKC